MMPTQSQKGLSTQDKWEVGMKLPVLIKEPSTSMLFRFSAVTWNAHRIHYDQAYARTEKHPDVLVQATMHGAFMLEALKKIFGPFGRIKSFDYMNRGRAVAGDTLTIQTQITEIDEVVGELTCLVEEHNQIDQLCAKGTAVIKFFR